MTYKWSRCPNHPPRLSKRRENVRNFLTKSLPLITWLWEDAHMTIRHAPESGLHHCWESKSFAPLLSKSYHSDCDQCHLFQLCSTTCRHLAVWWHGRTPVDRTLVVVDELNRKTWLADVCKGLWQGINGDEECHESKWKENKALRLGSLPIHLWS